MKRIVFLLLIFVLTLCTAKSLCAEKKPVTLQYFFSSNCKYCIQIKETSLSEIISRYKEKIQIEYFNVSELENFKLLLALEERFGSRVTTPAILIGNHLLIGVPEIKERLEPIIKKYIKNPPVSVVDLKEIDVLKKFQTFSPATVIAAGLIDGINPCAFTVIIFFISFLTLMGYKKSDILMIGGGFIVAVFLTYLAIGCGLFRGLYELKHMYAFIKVTYFVMAGFCFILAYFNMRDFLAYVKTKKTDALTLKLPKPIRMRINAIISKFYRKGQTKNSKSRFSLLMSAFLVGFFVSVLEAVCTGQVYLPTIVFILKEPALRAKAAAYLLLYNFMFVVPLLFILLLVLFGSSSKHIEQFFRERIALVKFLMSLLFLGLGTFLLVGG